MCEITESIKEDIDYLKKCESDLKVGTYDHSCLVYIKSLESKLAEAEKVIEVFNRALDESEKKFAVAVEALEFYGNDKNWEQRTDTRDSVIIKEDDWEDPKYMFSSEKNGNTHGGKRARAALKQLSEQ